MIYKQFVRFILGISILGGLYTGCQSTSIKQAASFQPTIVTADLPNFWLAYDSIQTSDDSLKQLAFLQTLFIDRASLGQVRMIRERNYSTEEYLQSILGKPDFWTSLRVNTENVDRYHATLTEGVQRLNAIYPPMRPSTIYYTMGTHRSPGTGVDSLVLIGTEYALGDRQTVVHELHPYRQAYYAMNPVEHLQLLTTHEYVHTQQSEMVHNLLSLTLYEGIAEFVAQIATGQASPYKAFTYGPANAEHIRKRFEEQMYNPTTTFNWLWNGPDNEFGTGDLGYYVGHAIAQRYYDQATDKTAAIQTLIELDYTDEDAVAELVDGTGYFSHPLAQLYETFTARRPTVVRVEGITNGGDGVAPSTTRITLHFSAPMNTATRGFDYGPLGEDNVLRVQEVIGFSNDDKAFTFTVKLDPGRRYQSLVTNRFTDTNGVPLQPYLLDFTTAGE